MSSSEGQQQEGTSSSSSSSKDFLVGTWNQIQNHKIEGNEEEEEQRIEKCLEKVAALAQEEKLAEHFKLDNSNKTHIALLQLVKNRFGDVEGHLGHQALNAGRTLLALSFSDHNNQFLLAIGLAETLVSVLGKTFPTPDTLKYNPKMDSSALGKLMANPDQGLKEIQSNRQAAIALQDSTLAPHEIQEREKFVNWQLLRRYAALLARNLAKAPPDSISDSSSSTSDSSTSDSSPSDSSSSSSSTSTSSTSHIKEKDYSHYLASNGEFIQALLASVSSVYESGEIVYYVIQALRLLFEGIRGEPEYAAARAEFLLSLEKGVEIIIGTAMTSRVVRKPSGEGLWVHFEASRLVAILSSVISQERRVLFLQKYACRTLANLVNGSKVAQLHFEGLNGIRLLLDAVPNAPELLMKQSSTSRHITMASLTALGSIIVKYQENSQPLSALDKSVADLAFGILRSFITFPDLPASDEDGDYKKILANLNGELVISTFVERFKEYSHLFEKQDLSSDPSSDPSSDSPSDTSSDTSSSSSNSSPSSSSEQDSSSSGSWISSLNPFNLFH